MFISATGKRLRSSMKSSNVDYHVTYHALPVYTEPTQSLNHTICNKVKKGKGTFLYSALSSP